MNNETVVYLILSGIGMNLGSVEYRAEGEEVCKPFPRLGLIPSVAKRNDSNHGLRLNSGRSVQYLKRRRLCSNCHIARAVRFGCLPELVKCFCDLWDFVGCQSYKTAKASSPVGVNSNDEFIDDTKIRTPAYVISAASHVEPLIPQKRSGFSVSLALTIRPSATTTVASTRLSITRPYWPAR